VDSPSAFASTHAAEAGHPPRHWTSRATRAASGADSATYLAVTDRSVVGIVGGVRPDPASSAIQLVSMWVAPSHRRAGIARTLVDAVIEWAGETGAEHVDLWVTRGNDAAVRLYEAAGFRETGDHRALPSDPCQGELRMRRAMR
jgi:ribosomal protein S18 acetylase RimI-like enzyme